MKTFRFLAEKVCGRVVLQGVERRFCFRGEAVRFPCESEGASRPRTKGRATGSVPPDPLPIITTDNPTMMQVN